MKNFGITLAVFVVLFTAFQTKVQAHNEIISVFLFGRDDCAHCVAEKAFLDMYVSETENVIYEYHNIIDDKEAADYFNRLIEKHELSQVTPLTVVGGEVIQGFNAPETTGVMIKDAVLRAHDSDFRTIEDHIERAVKQSDVLDGEGCDKEGKECNSIKNPNEFVFKLPFLGIVDLKTFSLFSLSAVLGTIDGFNPCAMWVLITFLVLLSQIGDRRKMILTAGIFIVAEAIMYNLILNIWFKTWDFVGLDAIVTPLIGLLAIGGGTFFLYRYRKNRNKPLVCDVSDMDSQHATTERIKDLVTRPTTIFTLLAIIALAFSVNVIEFACSIGIPQAYTKILEINNLDFVMQQFYILVYTLGYMVDDVVVFGLAIWGFSSLESNGHKYSQLSLLIGGLLMLALGFILALNPSLLVL
ncbi:MAG: glutaredoxin [Candidatus Pacebacteria bacterium]|nr:glutaredoxin [Candidatus Paceibacterota bacterium]MCF7857133.1 glutaredoxin [Candidatus Paceibacterota bacterium]